MSVYPKATVTNKGLEMIAESNAQSAALIFTCVKLGDGDADDGELTDLISPKLTTELTEKSNEGNGQLKVTFTVSNDTLEKGFRLKEIGVFAKVGEDGQEYLFAYTNGGNYTDWLPDKTNPIDSFIVDFNLVTGNAENVQVNLNKTGYVTEVRAKELISIHNIDETAHNDIRASLALGGAASFLLRQESTTYEVGDVVYSPLLKRYQRLECVVGGTSNVGALDTSFSATGEVIIDGGCTWLVIDSRDGTPVGAVRGSLYVPKGYILANGAEVPRADYPRLVAFADENELWVDNQSTTETIRVVGTWSKGANVFTVADDTNLDKLHVGDAITGPGLATGTVVTLLVPNYYTKKFTVQISAATISAGTEVTVTVDRPAFTEGMFGKGDGKTTFVLPNYVDKMAQFTDHPGISLQAGLPNIRGTVNGMVNMTTQYKALSYDHLNTDSGLSWNSSTSYNSIVLNAANCNSIYGNSDTVQPPAITLYPIIRY